MRTENFKLLKTTFRFLNKNFCRYPFGTAIHIEMFSHPYDLLVNSKDSRVFQSWEANLPNAKRKLFNWLMVFNLDITDITISFESHTSIFTRGF